MNSASGRAIVMTALGIPVAACLVIASTFVALTPVFAGFPLRGDDLIVPAIFGGLSLVILAIAWRAYRRVKTASGTSVAPLLSRAVPGLAIVGAVAGVVIGWKLGNSGVEALHARAESLCEIALDKRTELLPACREQAPRCLGVGEDQVKLHENESFSYDTSSPIHSRKDLYGVECLRTALKI